MYTTILPTTFARGTTAEKMKTRGTLAETGMTLALSRGETLRLIEWVSAHPEGIEDPLLLRLVSHYRGGTRREQAYHPRIRTTRRSLRL